MKEQYLKLKKLERKGVHIGVPVMQIEEWRILAKRDRTIPRSFTQLRTLGRRLFGGKATRSRVLRPEVVSPRMRRRRLPSQRILTIPRGYYTRRLEECLEEQYARYFSGLRNPYLTKQQRAILESDMDEGIPGFENSHETEHFILRWTNESTHAADNIADGSIVEETGDFLETAWEKYAADFGKTPYLPVGASKMEIIFEDIGGYGVASPPDGPIKFDAQNWVNNEGIRRPTSAHELFHKLQYEFGYRTKHTPSGDYKWFSEGTASWAEVFVWQRVSGEYKLLDLFSNPDLNLYSASYRALPYWIFFEARQKDSAADNPIVDLMQKYEALDATNVNPEREAYAEVIDEDWPDNNVYGNKEAFFALFSRDRRLGHWKYGPAGALYPSILGPDGTPVEPLLTVTEADLGFGDTFANGGSVSGFGSDYYRLNLEPDTDGETLMIEVDGAAGGDFSYYLIWEKNGQWKRASFPFHVSGDYGASETIDLATVNALMLVISGRGAGGAYTFTASVV